MKSPGWLSRRPRLWFVSLLIALPFAIIVTRTTAGEPGATTGQTITLVLLAVVALVFVVQLGRMLAGDDPDVPELAARLVSDADQRRLLERWMQRARWARNVGGICGVIVWIFGTRTEGDFLLCGVGGIAIGAMVAELHHVTPPRGTRTASLEVRSVDDYLMGADRRRMIAVGVTSAALLIGGLIVGEQTATWCGAASLAVLAAARLVMWRVASRPRRAIADRLRRADDLARELAIGRGLARPATYFGLALLARGAFVLSLRFWPMVLVGVACWVYAVYLWWSNRRLGLDFVLDQEPLLTA